MTKVLIAEDDDEIRALIMFRLTTAGFDVEPRFSPMELESLSAVSASLPAMVSSRRRSLS